MLAQQRLNWPTVLGALLTVGLFANAATPQQTDANGTSAGAKRELFERYLGAWTLTEHHYDAAGKVIATVKGTEEIDWVLDKRAIRRTYISKTESRTFRAIGLLTWNEIEKKYHGTWLDNTSEGGLVVVHGKWDAEGSTMVFAYSVQASGGVTRTFEVVDRFIDERKHIATTFETTGGSVRKLTEVEYKRAVPCPSKLRMLPDMGP